MYPDLPIEQLVRRKGIAFQFAFATEAKELVPQREEFMLSASHRGLQVLAKNEDGLATPVEMLREVYGPSLQVEPPKVRLIEGVQVKEPIMHVRISMCADFREVVKNALRRRGATLSEEYVRSTYCILPASPPVPRSTGSRSATTPS